MSATAMKQVEEVPEQDLIAPLRERFVLESGDVLSDGEVRLRRFGSPDAPQIVALGGISAGRFVSGADGWWSGVVGPGAGVDTRKYGVIGVDFAPLGDERVRISPFDQARLIGLALDQFGVKSLHGFVGASYGGMVGLAFAALFPERVERLCVICALAKPSALGAAWRGVQRRMVEFGIAKGDPDGGLSLARQLAMTTYRSAEEFETRFGAGVGDDGKGKVDSYLIARGDAYHRTMGAQRWLSLSEAIDRHAIEPETVSAATTLVVCPTDQLVPFEDAEALARALPNLDAFCPLPSLYGHDSFLKEDDALRPILARALERS